MEEDQCDAQMIQRVRGAEILRPCVSSTVHCGQPIFGSACAGQCVVVDCPTVTARRCSGNRAASQGRKTGAAPWDSFEIGSAPCRGQQQDIFAVAANSPMMRSPTVSSLFVCEY